MRKIVIQARIPKSARGTLTVWAAPFLLFGVFGCLSFLGDMEGVVFSFWAICPLILALTALLYLCHRRGRLPFWCAVAAILLVSAYLAYRLWELLWAQMQAFVLCFTRGTPADLTELVAFTVVVLTLLFFLMEFVLRWHFFLYFLTTALLLASPILGIQFSVLTLLLLLVFQLSFWVLQAAQKRHTDAAQSRAIAWKGGLAVCVLAALLLAVAAPLTAHFSEPLYNAAYAAEGFVTDTVRRLSDINDDVAPDGDIGTGNNHLTERRVLELTASAQPTERLYLYGFRGGDYLGGQWESAQEKEAQTMAGYPPAPQDTMHTTTLVDHEGNTLLVLPRDLYSQENPYFYLNRLFDMEWRILRISGENDAYMPYYGVPNPDSTEMQEGRFALYYETAQMHIAELQEAPSPYSYELPTFILENGKIVEDYLLAQTQKNYLAVPRERLPRLTALAEETPLKDLNEITAFIIYTLNSNTSYSLTPGWAPMNEDIVEGFLFERQTGYCEHYAATAALLYRLYGIPARYASGYTAATDDFVQAEDGTWTATVLESAAHAWVEIFLPDYGWTPVEFTPTLSGESVTTFPGFDSAELQRILAEKGWDLSVPSIVVETVESEPVRFGTALRSGSSSLLWILGICLAAALVLLPIFLLLRRARLLARLQRMNSCQIFARLLELLHDCKLLPDCDGTEADFAEQLAQAAPTLTAQETQELMALVNRAAFGREEDKSAYLVHRYYRKLFNSFYSSLPRRKQFALKYLKAYG